MQYFNCRNKGSHENEFENIYKIIITNIVIQLIQLTSFI